MQGVATKSMYGAFGVPIALLLWINFMAKLLLFVSSWTATRDDGDDRGDAGDAHEGDHGSDGNGAGEPPSPAPSPRTADRPADAG